MSQKVSVCKQSPWAVSHVLSYFCASRIGMPFTFSLTEMLSPSTTALITSLRLLSLHGHIALVRRSSSIALSVPCDTRPLGKGAIPSTCASVFNYLLLLQFLISSPSSFIELLLLELLASFDGSIKGTLGAWRGAAIACRHRNRHGAIKVIGSHFWDQNCVTWHSSTKVEDV